MAERFERNARTVTLLTFASRVTGLARDAALSRTFGINPLMDAFWFAFIIPNLFRRLFGEGALSAAFLPIYSQLDRSDPATARHLARLTIGSLMVVLGAITILGEIALLVLSTRAGQDHSGTLALRLMMIMLPYMPMVCLVAMLGAMLQVHGRFGPTAAAPVILNLCIVAAAVGGHLAIWSSDDPATEGQERAVMHITAVAIAVLLAGGLQVLWSIIALRRALPKERLVEAAADDTGRPPIAHFRQMLANFWPMLLGLGVLQLNVFIDGLIASYPSTFGDTIFGIPYPLETGSLTALSNAQRLYEFPLGVFGIAVATAIFPALAKVKDETAAFTSILRRGLRLVIFIGLPASIGLILVRVPLTAVILEGKNFTAEDTRRVAFVLMGYAPAIWAYSMTHTLTRAFYARGDSRTPMKVAVSMVALNFVLNVTLIWTPLREAGLAWSTAICAVVQVMILLAMIRRHAPGVIDVSVLGSWAKTVIVTTVMTIAVLAVDGGLSRLDLWEGRWRGALIELAALVATGAAAVAVAALALRMPELHWALGRSTGYNDFRGNPDEVARNSGAG